MEPFHPNSGGLDFTNQRKQRGVPVATVAINNSINAALLAARILGTYDVEIRERVRRYAQEMESSVLEKAGRLEGQGWEEYMVHR
jgi:phosphoribosylaminoimidazole carboxylase